MGKRNAYAVTLMAQKAKMSQEEKSNLIHRLLTTIYQASAVALNEEFGFGKDRIERFRNALDATICEYGVCMDSVDVDYADGKLEQVYQQIMEAQKREGQSLP